MVGLFTKIVANRRARIAWFAVTGRHSGISLPELVSNTLGPTCEMVAPKMIERVEAGKLANKIFFKGREDPLFFPSQIPLRALYMVLCELQPWNWHCYEVDGTRVGTDDVVFDCGAAEGYFSYAVAPRAKQVFAFEPLPDFTECLDQTFRDRDNVTVVRAGLSDERGTAYIQSSGISSVITSEVTPVPVAIETVDSFCAENHVAPTYLKADVEGFERKLIAGARETIQKHKPRIAITTYHIRGDADALESELKRLNPAYRFKRKGLEAQRGEPLMLHAW